MAHKALVQKWYTSLPLTSCEPGGSPGQPPASVNKDAPEGREEECVMETVLQGAVVSSGHRLKDPLREYLT